MICLAYFEKRIWNTYLTPLNFLSLPCFFITLLAIWYSHYSLDIPDFYIPSLCVWMVGLLLFFLPSLIFSRLCISSGRDFSKINKHLIQESYTNDISKIYPIMSAIAVICLGILFLKIRSISMESFGSEEFSEQYSSGGIYGHISVLATAICAFMIYIADRRHKFAYVIIGLSIICMYARGSKSWIIAPIVIGFVARILNGKTKFNYKFIFLILIICLIIYMFSYILILTIAGESEIDENFITFLFEHFIFYLIGSPLSFSIDYEAGIIEPYMMDAVFAPLINIVHLFTGEPYVQPINPISIDMGYGFGNVRTFIGTIFAYSNGWYGMILVILIFSIFINLFYALTRKCSNLFFCLANSTNLTFLSLGFFELYWLNLGTYEIFSIFCLFGFITFYPIKKRICYINTKG